MNPTEQAHFDSAPSPEQSLAGDERILAIAIEWAGIRVALLERVAGEHRLIGWQRLARSASLSMTDQLAEVCWRLGQRLGSVLWDEEKESPFQRAIDVVRFPPLQQIVVTASPRPLLRTFLVGLSDRISLSALRLALRSAPVQEVGSVVHSANLDVGLLFRQMVQIQPEVLVIVGGYDQRGEQMQEALLTLCSSLKQALDRLPRTQRPLIVYAGNQTTAAAATQILQAVDSPVPLEVIENVLPTPDVLRPAELARVLQRHYERLSQRIAGVKEISAWQSGGARVQMLEQNFAQLVGQWARQQELPALHGLYCASDWWLHVWAASDGTATQINYVTPGARPPELETWPPLRLVSGDWPEQLWPQNEEVWWDRTGLAPLIAAVGQVNPTAMFQVLDYDLL